MNVSHNYNLHNLLDEFNITQNHFFYLRNNKKKDFFSLLSFDKKNRNTKNEKSQLNTLKCFKQIEFTLGKINIILNNFQSFGLF